jgi:hypothetical protein
MHSLHYVAVVAETVEEAVELAEAALSHYGEGQCWDWYEIGGRWDGVFSEVSPYDNVLNYKDNPEAFLRVLTSVSDGQDREYRETIGKFTGATVSEAEVQDYAMGIPIQDKAGVALRVSQSNKSSSEQWQYLLQRTTVPTYGTFGSLGWELRCLGDLITGAYTFASHFLDGEQHTARVAPVQERCSESPDSQWLVAVDLHN